MRTLLTAALTIGFCAAAGADPQAAAGQMTAAQFVSECRSAEHLGACRLAVSAINIARLQTGKCANPTKDTNELTGLVLDWIGHHPETHAMLPRDAISRAIGEVCPCDD
jgi:hypothetical protein